MKKMYIAILMAVVALTSCEKILNNAEKNLNTDLMAQLAVDMRGLSVEECDSLMRDNEFHAIGALREEGLTTWERDSVGTIMRTITPSGYSTITAVATYKDYNALCARMWLTTLYGVAGAKAQFKGNVDNKDVTTYEDVRSVINTEHEFLQAIFSEDDKQAELRITYMDGEYQYIFRLNN